MKRNPDLEIKTPAGIVKLWVEFLSDLPPRVAFIPTRLADIVIVIVRGEDNNEQEDDTGAPKSSAKADILCEALRAADNEWSSGPFH